MASSNELVTPRLTRARRSITWDNILVHYLREKS